MFCKSYEYRADIRVPGMRGWTAVKPQCPSSAGPRVPQPSQPLFQSSFATSSCELLTLHPRPALSSAGDLRRGAGSARRASSPPGHRTSGAGPGPPARLRRLPSPGARVTPARPRSPKPGQRLQAQAAPAEAQAAASARPDCAGPASGPLPALAPTGTLRQRQRHAWLRGKRRAGRGEAPRSALANPRPDSAGLRRTGTAAATGAQPGAVPSPQHLPPARPAPPEPQCTHPPHRRGPRTAPAPLRLTSVPPGGRGARPPAPAWPGVAAPLCRGSARRKDGGHTPPSPAPPRLATPPAVSGATRPAPGHGPGLALLPIEAQGCPDVAREPTLPRCIAFRKGTGDWLREGRGLLRKSPLGLLLRAEGAGRAAAASEPGRGCARASMAALWAGLRLSL